MRKVRIKGLPNRASGGNAGGTGQGLNRFIQGEKNYDRGMNQFAEPKFEVNKSISAVNPAEANVEAEGGEYAVVPGMAGIPESYKINGPRHAQGGVPLNLAEDSFIFSDFRDMKIKDKDILAEFGVSVPKKGRVKGKTPSELAKKYDLNKYKKILLDPNSDTKERETAELMIKNFNMKLGKLALVQESKKGFPQDIPAIAMPYLQSIGQDPAQFANQPQEGQEGQQTEVPMAAYGGENKRMSKRFPGLDVAQRGGQYSGAFWDSILQEGGTPVVSEPNMEEQMYGIPSDMTLSRDEVITQGQEHFPIPENYKGDFYHFDTTAREGENPYFKTLGDRFRNTTKRFQPRRAKQTNVWQDGGTPVKSVETIPNFMKMTPGQRAGYNTAMDKFITTPKNSPEKDAYRELIEKLHAQGNYDIKAGADSVNTFYNPPITQGEEVPGYQVGGEKLEDQYQTAADYAADQIVPPANYEQGPEPQFVEPEVWNREIGGTKRSRARLQAEYLFSLIKDAEAQGMSEAEYTTLIDQQADAVGLDAEDYINETVSELTAAELSELKKNKFVLKKIQKATTVGVQTVGDKTKVSSKPVYKIPKGATVHEEDDNYKESNVKKGEYVRFKDGTVKKATGKEFSDFEYDQLDRIPEGKRDAYSRSYALLNKTLTDPKNKEMTDALYERYKDRISQGKIKDPNRKNTLSNISKEDMIKNLMRAQEQIYAITAAANDDPELMKRLNSGAMDSKYKKDPVTGKTYEKNELYAEILTDLGFDKEDILNDDQIAQFQGAFQGLRDISKDPKYTDNLKDFNLKPVGISDSDWEGGKNISPVDDWFGNTTIGQAAIAREDKMGFAEADLEAEKEVVKAADPNYIQSSGDAPWWAQDTGNMLMTLGERASLKKYLPHSFPVDLARPDVVYYDPSRALAANAEQSNIAGQNLSAFAGPQAASARMSGIQGQGFQQAANTLADYEAKNVGLANQYLDKVKGTADKENMLNAARMKTFYDENTIANQQFDNSKRAANRNIFDAWRQGLTNATKTQTMNMLYPQYNVDPRAGGITHFTEGRPQTEQTPPGSESNNYFAAWKQFQENNPDAKYEVFRDGYGLNRGRRRNSQRPQGNEFMTDYNNTNPYI